METGGKTEDEDTEVLDEKVARVLMTDEETGLETEDEETWVKVKAVEPRKTAGDVETEVETEDEETDEETGITVEDEGTGEGTGTTVEDEETETKRWKNRSNGAESGAGQDETSAEGEETRTGVGGPQR